MNDDLSDVIDTLSSGTYEVRRLPASVFVDGHAIEPVAADAWVKLTAYALGDRVTSDLQVWECSVAGTSSSTAPTGGTDAGTVTDGTVSWTWIAPAVSSTFTITASVQPLSGRQLDRLPELLRSREVQVLFTKDELRIASATTEGDLVTIDGDVWEVQQVENWRTLATFTRCLVARRGR